MIAGIVLAAGGSTRLGRPKGLVKLAGEPLVRRSARIAVAAGLDPVIVVLGSHASELRHALGGLRVRLAANEAWSDGIASSIRAGILALERSVPARRGALLMVADQPRVAPSLWRGRAARLVGAPFGMGAAAYDGRPGTPAVFAPEHLAALKSLEGDEGARSLLRRDPQAVTLVPWGDGVVDIDDERDVERLRGEGVGC